MFRVRRPLCRAAPRGRHRAAAKNCCVDPTGANKISFQHCVSCSSDGGPSNTQRHHDIARSLGDACTGAGIVATYESRRAGDGTTGVDLFVTLDGQRIAADITVVNPRAKTHIKNTLKKAGSAMVDAAKVKSARYKDMYDADGSVLMTLAFETSGAMGDGTKAFWNRLQSHIDNSAALPTFPKTYTTPTYISYMKSAVAVKLATWNARAVKNCITRANKRQ